jgi:hypothetical protein
VNYISPLLDALRVRSLMALADCHAGHPPDPVRARAVSRLLQVLQGEPGERVSVLDIRGQMHERGRLYVPKSQRGLGVSARAELCRLVGTLRECASDEVPSKWKTEDECAPLRLPLSAHRTQIPSPRRAVRVPQ